MKEQWLDYLLRKCDDDVLAWELLEDYFRRHNLEIPEEEHENLTVFLTALLEVSSERDDSLVRNIITEFFSQF